MCGTHKDGCPERPSRIRHRGVPCERRPQDLKSVEELYDRFMDRAAKKKMTLISIGGGILQDITGLVATTLYRGINWTPSDDFACTG